VSSLPVPSPTGRSVPQRRGHLGWAVAALLTLPLAAACGAGYSAASENVKPNSGAGTAGDLKVENVWVVVDPATGNAEVIGAISNSGASADQLTSVQAADSPATVRPPTSTATTTAMTQGVSVADGSVSVGPGSLVSFGQPGSPELDIPDSSLTPGTNAQVTFTFAAAGPVTVTALVQSNTGQFADYDPNTPTPTPTPTKAKHTATATGPATATGTTTATATATSTGTADSLAPMISSTSSVSPSPSS
jgi:hypothetical protein